MPVRHSLAAFGVLLLAVLLVGFLLPDGWHVERSISIAAPPLEVYREVADLHRWPEWVRWPEEAAPIGGWRVDAAADGTGARARWQSGAGGAIELRFVRDDPARSIEYELVFAERPIQARGGLWIEPEGASSRVTWRDTGELGYNPFSRYAGLLVPGRLSQAVDDSLASLKRRIEGGAPR
jgi:hypothetical protein